MACTLEHELNLWNAGAQLVAGVDEAGRGCLAGPVFAAAVCISRDFSHARLNDSKQLSTAVREEIYGELRADARLFIACASATVEEIERLNILRASHLAMERALRQLPVLPDGILIDGLPVKPFPFTHRAVVDGDALCLSIAAASIVAKVERDRYMRSAALEYPGYSFEAHKGYGTAAHRAALERLGPCALHRRTFGPVAQMTLAL